MIMTLILVRFSVSFLLPLFFNFTNIQNFKKLFNPESSEMDQPKDNTSSGGGLSLPVSGSAFEEPVFQINSPNSPSGQDDITSQLPSNYKLLNLLGEGAFSKVFKAINTDNNQVVAIKIINKLNLSSKQLNNIKNEIIIMSKNNHINLLKLLDSHNNSNYCYLILEYCDGGEIFNKIIEYTYFSEDLSRHVFVQLLDAIKYLHQNNIVHRDIKPENLLFQMIPYTARSPEQFKELLRKSDDDSKIDEGEFTFGVGCGSIGVIKLADFGLAKQLRSDNYSMSNLKTPCGTAGYTAPEVITCNSKSHRYFKNKVSKNNYYSKSVDIWSLGCFLYTILCGFPPFYDDNPEQLSQKILSGDYVFLQPWWDEISVDAKDLISRMLDINPESRITIDEIYQHSWIKSFMKNQDYKLDVKNTEDHYFTNSCYSSAQLKPSNESIPDVEPTQALLSPRAEAIKKVFNNPAMSNNVSVQFIENISEEEGLDSSLPSIPKLKNKIKLPRTPNPKDSINGVSFKDVFNVNNEYDDDDDDDNDDNDDNDDDDDDDEEEDEDEDDEEGDELTTLKRDTQSAGVISSSSSSVNSAEEDYQTRSSSIISGITGDFKFTLNLNDSNLLTRRKSSVSKNHLKPKDSPPTTNATTVS